MTVEEIARRAEMAFWESVAKDNPHITTEDMFPMEAYESEQACEQAVWRWLEHNDEGVDSGH